MAVSKMELLELVSKAEAGDVDFLREGVRVLAQALMEAEVSAQIGAEHSERTLDRVTHRNGYRLRDWDTRAGTIELAIPRVRQGSYLPSILEPRRRAEKALIFTEFKDRVGDIISGTVRRFGGRLDVLEWISAQDSHPCEALQLLRQPWNAACPAGQQDL